MCNSSNAKTLRLQHLQFPDIGGSCGHPDGARLVRDWSDELLVEQNSVSDGEVATPI